MKKCCKLFPLYFGENRRCIPRTWEQAKELIDYVVQNEISVDAGLETDLIMINMTKEKNSIEYFNKLNGLKTKSGKIITVQKGDDVGISFGAYNLVFEKFKCDYDYWFFLEDDQIITLDNYMKEFVEQLDSNPDLSFIAMIGMAHVGQNTEHANDGSGCTHVSYLNRIYNTIGNLPYCNLPGFPCKSPDQTRDFRQNYWKNHIYGGEVAFTNIHLKMGYKIEKFKGLKPYTRWISGNSVKCDMQHWGKSDYVHEREYEYI